MDTKALQQKILDLAIRGKLVPQDPNDEPASVLLERIREQKQQMVKDGKLKKKDIKNDSVIFAGEDNLHYEKFADGSVKCIEDEIPFELPEGWAWARLGTVCSKVTDGTHHSPDNYPIGEYKYITAKNIKLNGIILEDITYVTAAVHKEIFSRCNPEFGDILYIKDGATSGIATINTMHEEFSMLSSVALLKPTYGIDNRYMCYAMQSPYFCTTTRGDMKGVGITRITLLKEKGLGNYDDLTAHIENLSARLDALSDSIKAAEKRMVEVQALQQHIKNYRNTRQIYIEYRKSGYSKKFFEEHRQEITIHKAAKQAFDELQITKLPSMQSLYEEFHQLAVQKKQDYAEYRQIRKEKEELLIAKRTVETILNIDRQKEQEKEKEKEEKKNFR